MDLLCLRGPSVEVDSLCPIHLPQFPPFLSLLLQQISASVHAEAYRCTVPTVSFPTISLLQWHIGPWYVLYRELAVKCSTVENLESFYKETDLIGSFSGGSTGISAKVHRKSSSIYTLQVDTIQNVIMGKLKAFNSLKDFPWSFPTTIACLA